LAVEFLDPGETLLSQGDLLRAVPSVYVRSTAYLVATARNNYQVKRQPPEAVDPAAFAQANAREVVDQQGEDAWANAIGGRRMAIVLSHDCELDKPGDKRYVQTALIRSLEDVPEAFRDGIREYEQKRAFYLPPNDYLEGENFVDLRMITTSRRAEVIDELERVAVMNEDGRVQLRFQLFSFYARKRLPEGWENWPDDVEEEGERR
jgi:hypothetical protein